MTAIITFFHLWSIPSVIARLIIATLAGAIIGLDREAKNKEAGLKPMPWSVWAPRWP